MSMMRAIVAEGSGGPEVLRLVERPRPEPGAGEIRIRVVATGINRPDLMQRAGMPLPPEACDIFGLEVAGYVDAVGPGVTGWRSGDRIMALVNGGGYADHCLAWADHCLPVEPDLDLVAAAALPEALFTLWHNLYERGCLAPGERLLIHGGASGLGSLAVQLARATGARVVATAGNADKVAVLRSLGVELAIDYRETDFVTVIEREFGVDAIDVVLDTVGGDYLSRNLRLLAPEGRHVSLSFFRGAEVTLPLPVVMQKGLTLSSSSLRPKSRFEKARIARAVAHHLLPLIVSRRAVPVIYATLDLERAAEAHHLLENNRNIGKVVLVVDRDSGDAKEGIDRD